MRWPRRGRKDSQPLGYVFHSHIEPASITDRLRYASQALEPWWHEQYVE